VLKRWTVAGTPRGLAIAADGTIYLGLADRQSVVAIDPKEGSVLHEVVLDSADIASTKELVTLRIDEPRQRLIIANGTDESVTILSIPGLEVLREITLEGEVIRDAVPDPGGRYLYVLGRTVHVFDVDGTRELRSLRDIEPMAIAVNAGGTTIAVIGSEQFSSGRATVAALYETGSLKELAREPLQTDRIIRAAVFGANDQSLIVVAQDWLAEKTLLTRKEKTLDPKATQMRISFDFGDLVSSERICLPAVSGPQIVSTNGSANVIYFAERRCSQGGSFTGSQRRVASASLYGVNGYAVALDPLGASLFVTDSSGLSQYRLPKPRQR